MVEKFTSKELHLIWYYLVYNVNSKHTNTLEDLRNKVWEEIERLEELEGIEI